MLQLIKAPTIQEYLRAAPNMSELVNVFEVRDLKKGVDVEKKSIEGLFNFF